MKRVLIFSLGFVLVLSTAGFAMHHDGGMHGGGMHHGNNWWQNPAVAEMINLSAEETDQMSGQWVQHRRKMIALKGSLNAEKFELEVLDDQKEVDGPGFRDQFNKMQKARADIEAERFNYRMAVRNLLGAERFAKIKSHFPMLGEGSMKDDKGMMGMGCGMGRMQGKQGRGAKGGCPMMGTPQAESDPESSPSHSDHQ